MKLNILFFRLPSAMIVHISNSAIIERSLDESLHCPEIHLYCTSLLYKDVILPSSNAMSLFLRHPKNGDLWVNIPVVCDNNSLVCYNAEQPGMSFDNKRLCLAIL